MPFKTTEKEIICSVCGKNSVYTIIVETDPPTSSPDLDLRPDEPHRGYYKYWVKECPECGYCNSTPDVPFDHDKAYLKSEEYTSVSAEPDETAALMIKSALVALKNHSYQNAVQSYMYAAWAYDDRGDAERAERCRRSAVRVFDENPAAFLGDDNFKVLLADLIRRSGDFDRVVREYEGKRFSSPLMTAIAAYQVELAKKRDGKCHKANEVPGVMVK